MGEQAEENKPQKRAKHICAGLLAHVDAGKTTLAEGILYTCGQIRKLGRVDHGNAFLDNLAMERERGITIFSKQAQVTWKGLDITLLDTPGHVDFSAEMERTLQVLDYAVLVISGLDGVQGHVQTLWKLLRQYGIPVFIFVNKMDRPGAEKTSLLAELRRKLDDNCHEFGDGAEERGGEFLESLAMCDERLMEEYLETGGLNEMSLARAIAERHIFPCYFGAALHLEGVEELLGGIRRYALCPEYPKRFRARVYKISRDESGNRLTHLKVTGGELRVKMAVSNAGSAQSESEMWEEKADQLRIYNGAGYSTEELVKAGEICAVTGLERTFAGQGLGEESTNALPVLVPVLNYGLVLPEGSDAVKVLGQLHRLEEEEPQLRVVWQRAAASGQYDGERPGESRRDVPTGKGIPVGKRHTPEIHVQVMGEVQIEVLKRLILERFGLDVKFTDGRILYKETIARAVEGIGHFEPLRHYAEVHLLLEPGEPGSGLQFASVCSEDVLDRNWQRLILTHLEEKTHLGVLTGSPITDMRITLLTGRAHIKHTEGGDFRQATYRAVRQGLMQSENILLEPVFSFSLEVPAKQLGRAMSDIQRMHGSFDAPMTEGESAVITGTAPVATMRDYQREVNAYTRGLGRLTCVLKGYEPCHNAEEVIAQLDYYSEADTENPASSVFCAHGAGFLVPWNQVEEYAHLESGWKRSGPAETEGVISAAAFADGEGRGRGFIVSATGGSDGMRGRETGSDYITQEEIEEIFQRTYGKSKRDYEPYRYYRRNTGSILQTAPDKGESSGDCAGATCPKSGTGAVPKEEYLLVDGYNIIFAWEDLRSLAEVNIDSARDRLMDICCNYQGFRGGTLILVYDAYKVKGNPGSVQRYHNIYVVYTKEAETADQYIEKTVHRIGRKYQVTVATSDRLEQMIIWGAGAARLSAQGFREAVEAAAMPAREEYLGREQSVRNILPIPSGSEVSRGKTIQQAAKAIAPPKQ